MKQGRTIQELGEELFRQSESKRDLLAPVTALAVRTNGESRLRIADHTLADGYPIGEVAHGQLAEYTGIPKAFYDRLRTAEDLTVETTEDPQQRLYDTVVNRLLQAKGQDGDKRLIRTLDGNARAILSQSYNPDLDNYDVYRYAVRAMVDHGIRADLIASTEVTERRLYLKVLHPNLEATVNTGMTGGRRVGQVVRAGFLLTNSEVGLGALSVSQFVEVLVCTNGMVRSQAYRQRHLGRLLESGDDGAIYRDDTRRADAQTRLLMLRDNIAGALSDGGFQDWVNDMQRSAETPIGHHVEGTVDLTAKKYSLSKDERDGVLAALIEGGDLSQWGLANAVTLHAGRVESYDRATELEQIGGQIVALPSIADIVATK